MEHSKKTSSWKYAIPFFVVLAVLSIVSFLIPLRPEVSYLEKRELKKFPEFSMESLVSGEYFSDVALWFSDTFPGRESWISLSQELSGYYGYGDFSIQGARPVPETIPPAPTLPEPIVETEPETTAATEPETTVEPETVPETTEAMTEAATEPETEADDVSAAQETDAAEPEAETTEAPAEPEAEATEAPTEPETETTEAPPAEPETEATEAPAEPETEATTESIEEQQRESVLLDLIINDSSVIQLGDTVFYPVGFSQYYSDLYVRALTKLADKLADLGTRVISSIPPTAVGVLVPDEYLKSIRSYPQTDILDYLTEGLGEKVVSVDTVRALLEHKDEYLFFHTDHHWTATAAYYAYRATCEALGMVPAELDEFEELNQGKFIGSIYGKASNVRKLGEDYVLSYDPIGNIKMYVVDQGYSREEKIVRDMRSQNDNAKYLAFLHGDEPMVHIVNEDLPEGTVCLIIKDSFGNCFVPYFTKNYHDVYAIDYRKYYASLPYMVNKYNIQDIIFAPNMMSVQSDVGVGLVCDLCGLNR